MGRPRLKVLAFAAVALVLFGALAWRLYLAGAFLPSWATWETRTLTIDLTGDGADEVVQLADKRLRVRSEDTASEAVMSDASWLVQDVLACDVDYDGTTELVAVVWRRGLYGDELPFWVERNDTGFSQHVFVLRYDGKLVPEWMSSEDGVDIAQVSADETGALRIVEPSGDESTWVWDSWGFVRSDEAASPEEDEGDGIITLLAVGDNIIHEGIYENAYDYDTGAYDFSKSYVQVADWVSSFDIAVVTQETPLVASIDEAASYPVFGTPDAVADALAGAGFDVVCAATNHALDQGIEGIDHTLAYWHEHHPEVTVLGMHATREDAAKTTIIEREGIRIALIDATYGLNGQALPAGAEWRVDVAGSEEMRARLERRVRAAEPNADLTICFLHEGEEYEAEPSASQLALEQRLADAGADAIICSHAHVLQAATWIERAGGGECAVFHGLGNFLSYQLDPQTTLGGAARLVIERADDGRCRIAEAELLGTVCHLETDGACVYRLEDYTDELAASHYLNGRDREGEAVSVASLEEQLARAQQL